MAAAITNPEIFRVTPANVAQVLRGLVELKTDVRTEHQWTFAGASPDAGIRWAEADFQPEQPASSGKWQLLQISLELVPPEGDVDALYEALTTEIALRLGRPQEPEPQAPSSRRAWRVAPYWEVAIREPAAGSARGAERFVTAEVAVLQGEEEH